MTNLEYLTGYLETLHAILVLEYRDKNHLYFGTNPKKLNEEQRELVERSLAIVRDLKAVEVESEGEP